MARVRPYPVLSAPVGLPVDFYRQEFLKHREQLARQKESFSERAITDADAALSKVLGRIDQLCAEDDSGQLMGKLLRQFNAVTGLSGWTDPRQLH